ncbi:MAG: sugar ABC transporter ATP-binding protein, partial [Oscillospiraceae bacterium]|nr:sugar ABC transporter ATP-binding protein [Oscillospiraceae bacterium]
MNNTTTFFEMRGISKSFPGVKALDNVGFTVAEGEVRALVGENGAGKSTLMKILNGNYKKDCGEILIDGVPVNITNPQVADSLGITIIFQELNLVDELSIAENIFAGRLATKGKLINWKEINEKARQLLERVSFQVDPTRLVGTLTVAEKQMVEIAKALSRNSRIILMDEPSATLTKKELGALFQIIRDLKESGIAVIYISHRMEEIFEICESVTVMRDGQIIGTRQVADVSSDELVEMMVGREVSSAFPKRSSEIGEEVLRVENLCRKDRSQNVAFSLRKGEVLGIAGLVGAGRTEIMRAIFGVDYIKSLDVYVKGEKVKITNPAGAKKHNIAFLTEDRKAEG